MSTREDYFAAAYRLMAEGDPSRVTLQALCELVGTTSGSFYHHFGSMAGFVSGLADYYEQSITSVLKGVLDADSVAEAETRIDHAVATMDMRVGAAMRAWARTDPTVAAAVARADEARRDMSLAVLAETSPDLPLELRERYADLTLLVFVGAQMLDPERAGEVMARGFETLRGLVPRPALLDGAGRGPGTSVG